MVRSTLAKAAPLDVAELDLAAARTGPVWIGLRVWLDANVGLRGVDIVGSKGRLFVVERRKKERPWLIRASLPVVEVRAGARGTRLLVACECGRPVQHLYIRPGGRWLACRRCHGLDYPSQRLGRGQRFDRDVRRYRELSEALESEPLGSRSWWITFGRRKRVAQSVDAGIKAMPPLRLPPLERPPRGRPSKQVLRERAREERLARKARSQGRPGRPRTKRKYERRQPIVLTPRRSESEAYCTRCRDRREMEGPTPTTLRNGRSALRGSCATCGCALVRIVPSRVSS